MAATLIIGAGPAGLTAAYELCKLGISPVVLEADAQVGGLARTINYHGYRFDIGGHRFFSKVPLINALWQELLGADFMLRPRLSRIHYRGRFFDYPLKPLNALAGLGPVEAALVCLSYARSRLRRSRDESSFEQWVANRFGYRLYEIFFKTYTEKVWGIPCAEISVDWAAQRIKNLSLGEALRNALRNGARHADGQVITTLIEEFRYPRLGPGMMWERCAEAVSRQGGATMHGMHVERLSHRHGRVVCVAARDAAGNTREFEVEHVISSMPVRDLIRALDPPAPAAVRRAAEELRYRDYLTVVLILRRTAVFPDNWIYVHSPEVKLGRVQNYKNWSPEMVPDPSRTSLGLEYFLWDTDPQWTWSDERLIDAGISDCAHIGLIAPQDVEGGTVLRVPKAYPVYDQHYQANLGIVRQYLASLPNLQLVGRNGQHRYNNQDHSMLTGIYAARNIAGARYDVWSVNTEQEYHEEVRTPAPAAERGVPQRLQPAARAPLVPDAIVEAVFARLDPVALGAAFGVVGALGLFVATAVLLLRGGTVVGPHLALLAQYLAGYQVSWTGVAAGMLGVGAVAGSTGYVVACLRNWGLSAYAAVLRRRATAAAERELLDRV